MFVLKKDRLAIYNFLFQSETLHPAMPAVFIREAPPCPLDVFGDPERQPSCIARALSTP